MNIEELNLEYKNKMDKLLEEYKAKVKEVTKKEEPFIIEEGQEYFYIDSKGKVHFGFWNNNPVDQQRLEYGNIFPYTEETRDKLKKEVELIAERKKLQSEMEMFARQNNEGEIDWNDGRQDKYYLYIDYTENNIRKGYALSSRHFNTVYFTSKEIAKKALEKFGDRIRKLYLDAEEV